jgi:hypothetical protein
VEAKGTGNIDELCFVVTYNDGTNDAICVYTDWEVNDLENKEITIPVDGRVVFVELN